MKKIKKTFSAMLSVPLALSMIPAASFTSMAAYNEDTGKYEYQGSSYEDDSANATDEAEADIRALSKQYIWNDNVRDIMSQFTEYLFELRTMTSYDEWEEFKFDIEAMVNETADLLRTEGADLVKTAPLVTAAIVELDYYSWYKYNGFDSAAKASDAAQNALQTAFDAADADISQEDLEALLAQYVNSGKESIDLAFLNTDVAAAKKQITDELEEYAGNKISISKVKDIVNNQAPARFQAQVDEWLENDEVLKDRFDELIGIVIDSFAAEIDFAATKDYYIKEFTEISEKYSDETLDGMIEELIAAVNAAKTEDELFGEIENYLENIQNYIEYLEEKQGIIESLKEVLQDDISDELNTAANQLLEAAEALTFEDYEMETEFNEIAQSTDLLLSKVPLIEYFLEAFSPEISEYMKPLTDSLINSVNAASTIDELESKLDYYDYLIEAASELCRYANVRFDGMFTDEYHSVLSDIGESAANVNSVDEIDPFFSEWEEKIEDRFMSAVFENCKEELIAETIENSIDNKLLKEDNAAVKEKLLKLKKEYQEKFNAAETYEEFKGYADELDVRVLGVAEYYYIYESYADAPESVLAVADEYCPALLSATNWDEYETADKAAQDAIQEKYDQELAAAKKAAKETLSKLADDDSSDAVRQAVEDAVNYIDNESDLYYYLKTFTELSTYVSEKTEEIALLTAKENDMPAFYGCSMVFDGSIGLRFFTYVPENFDRDGSYVVFSMNGADDIRIGSDDFVYDAEKKRCIFTYKINAIQMAEEITAAFYDSDGNVLSQKSISLDKYCDILKHTSHYYIESEFLDYVLDFGRAAQTALSLANGWKIGVDYAALNRPYTANSSHSEALNDYAYTKSGSDDSVSGLQYTLTFDTLTDINFYITSETAPVVTIDGTAADVTEFKAGVWKASISGIPAHELGKPHTVSVNGNISITNLSALSYANAICGKSAELTKLANAIYDYYSYAQQVNSELSILNNWY